MCESPLAVKVYRLGQETWILSLPIESQFIFITYLIFSQFCIFQLSTLLAAFVLEMRTGRAGPGRAGLTFLGPRAERAENGQKPAPERNKVETTESKFLIKVTKQTFSIEDF